MEDESKESTLELWPDSNQGYRLQAKLALASPIDDVFDFFSKAENLERLTPLWLNFKILTPLPVEMGAGTLLDYKIRLHYIPIRWRTEIAIWEPPFRFVDQQLRGPYRKWYHEHTFEDLGNGQTLVTDNVHYIPRGGSLIHRWLVKPDLVRIFTYRQREMEKVFPRVGLTDAKPFDHDQKVLQECVPKDLPDGGGEVIR